MSPDPSETTQSPPSLHRSRKRQRTADAESFQCQVCLRSYDRADHLNRHLDSHRNERPFRCDQCPAAFNRRSVTSFPTFRVCM
ncbi:hypothetical protein BU24DRAFT_339894 [Aaosphaeria arxii CBS 175.79]|uniref:C2H2-type domain-containing protein n=1 Tax=Aaosphaeria arxii CBS 175.79 TaxID=1450172 RepID=A0A6A5Y9Z2_9PLEO|nr:uncharacterized protein BU24DRAFT_339894 [Aaosphaeria arxii CBS 175.79]KAF2022405.1 hypothetical protein BU24DRAFT_339894 [Aaosphaeria arxii CBS 175.79]